MSKVSKVLTIANGETESDELNYNALRFATSLAIYPPDTLSGTVSVEVAAVRNPAAADWRDLQSEGADVALTADKALVLTDTAFFALRLKTTLAPGADEVYQIVIND